MPVYINAARSVSRPHARLRLALVRTAAYLKQSRRDKLRARLAQVLSDTRGVAAVEFALVLPLLVVLLTAIAQFGTLFSVYSSMVNASREAARSIAVEEFSITEAETVADQSLATWQTMSFNIATTIPDPNDPNDRDVIVTVSVPMSDAIPVDYLGMFTGTLEAQTVMREE